MNLWNIENTISLEKVDEKNTGDRGEAVEKLYDKIDFHYAFKKLSRRQKQVIQLRIEGYHCFEIAEELGINVKTVYNHLYRAKKKLGNSVRGVV